MATPFDDRDGKIWMDGELVDWRDAKVHILTHALHYASAVFEGERCYDGKVFKTREHAQRLIRVTQECLYIGMALVKPGTRLGDIGHAIQQHAESNYYSVVRDYCGHGIGNEFHEEPQVMHFGRPGTGLELQEGMTFTIEPMINAGKHQTKLKSDGWTVETRDGRLSAQWEHTMAVTATGVEVLTARGEEIFPWMAG